MGWDYSAKLVYGVLVKTPIITTSESFIERIENICYKHGVKYCMFFYYGSAEQQAIICDEYCVESYLPNAIKQPETKPLSENVLAVLKELGVKAEPKWYLGVSVS